MKLWHVEIAAFVLIAQCCQSSAWANDIPTQVYRFHIGSSHLDSSKSRFLTGKPEVRIVYQRGGETVTWSSTKQFPGAKGVDYNFDHDFDLLLDMDVNAHIGIQLVDVGQYFGSYWTTPHVDKTFPVMKLREVVAGGRLNDGMSWLDVRVVDPAGRYTVSLERTSVAPEDFEAVGGTFPKNRQFPPYSGDYVLHPVDSFNRWATEWMQIISESAEKCDHLVIVEQNGTTVFKSNSTSAPPQGLAVTWNAKFEIDWKPNDKITVRFQDWNRIKRNTTILEQTDNSTSSISLLEGVIQGGVQGRSRVFFSSHRLEGR